MSRSCTIVLVLCGLAASTSLPGSAAQAASSQYDSSAISNESRNGWYGLGGLYALLAQHDALGGHALARKSVRSPSRRLRFGRRSDPDMPPQAPLDELDELLSLREVRSPVRLRFGRRSDEHAVPHIFPQELEESDDDVQSLREARSPARLRFGRRSDEHAAPHTLSQELNALDEVLSMRQERSPARLRFGRRSDEHAVPHVLPQEDQDRDVRAPAMRLRFGRRSDNNMFVMPFDSALPKDVKANGSVEDDRQQD